MNTLINTLFNMLVFRFTMTRYLKIIKYTYGREHYKLTAHNQVVSNTFDALGLSGGGRIW